MQGCTPAEDEGGPPLAQQMQPQGHARAERATWGVRGKDHSQSAQDHLEGSWGWGDVCVSWSTSSRNFCVTQAAHSWYPAGALGGAGGGAAVRNSLTSQTHRQELTEQR